MNKLVEPGGGRVSHCVVNMYICVHPQSSGTTSVWHWLPLALINCGLICLPAWLMAQYWLAGSCHCWHVYLCFTSVVQLLTHNSLHACRVVCIVICTYARYKDLQACVVWSSNAMSFLVLKFNPTYVLIYVFFILFFAQACSFWPQLFIVVIRKKTFLFALKVSFYCFYLLPKGYF